MTPQEALQISKDNAPSLEKDVEWIYKQIRQRAEKGYTHLSLSRSNTYDMKISNSAYFNDRIHDACKYLEQKGWNVRYGAGYGEYYATISWNQK